jgi:DNA invertase Pin-like site-specific DNA recombinase
MTDRVPDRIETLKPPGKYVKTSTVAYFPELPDLRPIGVYMRLSLKKATEDLNRLALARQDVSRRLPGDVYIYREYTDPDHSAFKRGAPRPAYDRMLADLDAGIIKGLAVYDIDRLTRRHFVLESIIERYLENPGLYWFCLDPAVDLRTEAGRATARDRVNGAHQEALAAQRRQQARHDQLKAMGVQVAIKGYGYDDDGQLVLKEAAAIQKLAALVVQKADLKPYLTQLTANGVMGPSGQPLTPSSVRRILMSARLVGYRVDGKASDGIARDASGEPIEGTQEAILKPEQWEAVRRVYLGRAGAGRGDLASARDYLLSGLLRCGRCGYAMGGSAVKNRKAGYRYICPGGGGGRRCGRCNVNGPLTDEYLTAWVEARLAQAPSVAPVAPEWPLQAEEDDVRAQQAQDLADYQDGIHEGATWQALDRSSVMRLAELRRARKVWAESQPAPVVGPTAAMAEAWASGVLAVRRNVLMQLASVIIVTPGGPWAVDRLNIVGNDGDAQ